MSDSSDPPGRAGRVGDRPSRRVLRTTVVGAFISLLLPGVGEAQSGIEALSDGCTGGGSVQLAVVCRDAALAVYALKGGVGLLMSAGGPIPSSPSTAGRRLASQPRIVLDGGLGWSAFRHPDLSGGMAASGPTDRRSLWFGGRAAASVGLFEGFSPMAGVGGVLSVDGVGMLQLLRVDGTDGGTESVFAWGAGVRLGVMRESFSLPGLTLSVMHHRAGDFMVGATGESGALVELDPRVTSVRAIVGKDLLTAGLSAGVGWDRYGGSDRIRARVPGGTGFEEGRGGPVDAIVRKRYLFLGANFTWLVTQAAGELGWVWGTSPEPGIEGAGGYRPGGTELQGALTFRITY